MFILILTFLCSVAVLEEYMFLFTTRPNLICPAYFMSMEWEKFLFLFSFRSTICDVNLEKTIVSINVS